MSNTNESAPVAALPAWATALIGDRVSESTKRLLSVAAVWTTVKPTVAKLWKKYRAQVDYVVTVPGDDPVFDDLHAWLQRHLPPAQRTTLMARTIINRSGSNGYSDGLAVPDDDRSSRRRRGPGTATVSTTFDSSIEQTITIGGHRIRVSTDMAKQEGITMNVDRYASWAQHRKQQMVVKFVARTVEGQDAVLAFLTDVALEQANQIERVPSFYIADRWGSWNSDAEITPRSLDTVVLAAGQANRIVGDLDRFLSREPNYAKLGVPWHRGYLLSGPPGTGKTSLARALASHFGLDLYWIPLGDLESDGNLMQLISRVRPRSVLLLEDVDVAGGEVLDRDKQADAPPPAQAPRVTMSGLLNALDGVATPHGLITIMTSNRPEVLDPALVRKGRIDVHEQIGFLDTPQLQVMLRRFVGPGGWSTSFGIASAATVSPADVVGAIVDHLDDEQRALDAVRALPGVIAPGR